MQERLQKIIAAAGVASRRKAEELIQEGRVTVNGQTVTELGTKANAATDYIKVNGRLIRRREWFVYLLLNKPAGYVSTLSDPQRRPTVLSVLKGVRERVYPVGRLDYHSSGIMLMTNDGDLANHLMSRATAVPRTYHVKLERSSTLADLKKLEEGIVLDGRRTAPCRVWALASPAREERGRPRGKLGGRPGELRIRDSESQKPWYEITVTEGRYHQVRRMFERIGQQVLKLKRVGFGFLTDAGLSPGSFRHLTPEEVRRLKGVATSNRSLATNYRHA